jgi:threonine/homoserine/homoserine lactone efflux protein
MAGQASLWVIFSLSFVTALSGALMPGPLLTYTIARTVQSPRRGWLTGALVISGHAVLESVLLAGLLLGVVGFLRAPLAAKIIGVAGAALLVTMGVGLIREVIQGRAGDLTAGEASGSGAARMHPALAGALVSMSNPYWWIWWVTIGSAFLIRFDLTTARWEALAAFFLGHELGDLGWYLTVSTVLYLGKRVIPLAVIQGLLAFCGVVIIGFAAYLGISPFLAG